MMTPFPILISSMVRFVVNIAGARFPMLKQPHLARDIAHVHVAQRHGGEIHYWPFCGHTLSGEISPSHPPFFGFPISHYPRFFLETTQR